MLTEVGAIGFVLRAAKAPEMDTKKRSERNKMVATFAPFGKNNSECNLNLGIILIKLITSELNAT